MQFLLYHGVHHMPLLLTIARLINSSALAIRHTMEVFILRIDACSLSIILYGKTGHIQVRVQSQQGNSCLEAFIVHLSQLFACKLVVILILILNNIVFIITFLTGGRCCISWSSSSAPMVIVYALSWLSQIKINGGGQDFYHTVINITSCQ